MLLKRLDVAQWNLSSHCFGTQQCLLGRWLVTSRSAETTEELINFYLVLKAVWQIWEVAAQDFTQSA